MTPSVASEAPERGDQEQMPKKATKKAAPRKKAAKKK
jgi:hypothetical protein